MGKLSLFRVIVSKSVKISASCSLSIIPASLNVMNLATKASAFDPTNGLKTESSVCSVGTHGRTDPLALKSRVRPNAPCWAHQATVA